MLVLCVQENSARHAKRLPKTASGNFFCLPWTRHARLAQTVLLGRFLGSSHHPVSVNRKCPVMGACSPLLDWSTYEDPWTHMHQSLNPDRCAPEECTKPNTPRKKSLVQLHPVVEPLHSSPVACTPESHSP